MVHPVIAVRHGESEWNARYAEHRGPRHAEAMRLSDCGITALGKAQSASAGQALCATIQQRPTWVLSPLRRCVQTALRMLSTCDAVCKPKLIIIDPALAERCTDACDIGTEGARLAEEFAAALAAACGEDCPGVGTLFEGVAAAPGGVWWYGGQSEPATWALMQRLAEDGEEHESEDDFRRRLAAAKSRLCALSADAPVVAVVHSEVIFHMTAREKAGELFGHWAGNGEAVDITEHVTC